MTIKPGKKPKRRGDRHELIRGLPGTNTPPLYKPKKGSKFADPEEILQDQVNQALTQIGQYQFRIPASVYAKAHDQSIRGWPDSPLITRLGPGLALLTGLELKKEGKTMSKGQVDLEPVIGTVEADNWDRAWAIILWHRDAVEHVRALLRRYPLLPPPTLLGAQAPVAPAEIK